MGTRISKLAVLAMFFTVGTGSSTRVVAVDEEVVGKWGDILDFPLMPIHMILLKNGKVLCVYDAFDVNPNRFMIFDPAEDAACSTQVITTRPLDPEDDTPILLFCAGHSQLPDGKILLVGGGLLPESSHNQTVIFDPDEPLCAPWIVEQPMPDVVPPGADPVDGNRWYPTVTTLGDGTALVVAGDDSSVLPDDRTADIPLIFDWTKQSPELQYSQLPGAKLYLPFYPFNFLLSDGTILYAGVETAFLEENSGDLMFSKKLDLTDPTPTWTNLSVPHLVQGGSAVMYGPDLIMKGGRIRG